jgi:hypothetical protein
MVNECECGAGHYPTRKVIFQRCTGYGERRNALFTFPCEDLAKWVNANPDTVKISCAVTGVVLWESENAT